MLSKAEQMRNFATRPRLDAALAVLTSLLMIGSASASVDIDMSVMVRKVSVVEDTTRTFNPCTNLGTPMGKWTFGYLMQQMANQPLTNIDPAVFVRNWLAFWEQDQVINTWQVPRRAERIDELIINPWPKDAQGKLDLSKAPFKLLAIVNRVDLRGCIVTGPDSPGESRMVFGALDVTNNCAPLQFTVIFEYGNPVNSCPDLQGWGRQWINLASSTNYNRDLEAITEQFARANAVQGKPNGSAINQVRSNEIALQSVWEMREFRLPNTNGYLQEVTVKQTPDISLNNTDVVANYINANEVDILHDPIQYVVPNEFPPGRAFLAGAALVPNTNFFWNGRTGGIPINSGEARHRFSLNTCNSCHSRETMTVFTHVKPAAFTTMAAVSDFLCRQNPPGTGSCLGITVPDPAGRTPDHFFNELPRRAADLDYFVNNFVCPLSPPYYTPHSRVH
jgi:hypothetical protein